ncbi:MULTISPECIES: uroporphyrinogen decarboxylase family protein [unclassified Paenibacillus]|uniref:uroporphyrinogen decarboxylase family protein n=1 Tax=unclassified Paenibacillus TaxID=185978 RepID=UPI0024068637|nr:MULTISPECIES: uroporphyrinogen decarboxylase family protein [unclassified Paenibacillus]MDF9841491.1 uroporphyrinogen decarboxylase [Paenibacillus sp. PastF-2]MDF9848080.1 uroporphyrinogen decarboxylase [Paenibacillus sp. PastM-2]MDF9854649.1 uroporphyrinogen decarboxylase [Paenibacillus sp. PastF-1]MDH6479743.1 uroporphyrinogen decarboxylase [Paenibacillus sp. PastH-2]MDH6507355.1 uroporphyrinogen decarboxylase [Paenibacillus sp. PastM-3]
MSNWSKQDRFRALLSGERADRPIVSGWRHFIDKEQTAEDLAATTISFTKQYDWDWVKINPRATYLAEAWGNQYDFADYQTVFPRQKTTVIPAAENLWELEVKKAADTAVFQEHLEAVKQIRQGLPDTPLIQTIFSPLTVLLFIVGRSAYVTKTVFGIEQPVTLESLFKEHRAAAHHALHVISLTLADYVKELQHAGSDGLFYAVTGTAHPGLFDEAIFDELSRPYDSIVLEAASYGKNILHTCGAYSQPEKFNDYRIDGISWDTVAEGNPGLGANLKATKVGGVDHGLFAVNDIAQIRQQAKDALTFMQDQPFILSPNCAIPLNVKDEALVQFKNIVLE